MDGAAADLVSDNSLSGSTYGIAIQGTDYEPGANTFKDNPGGDVVHEKGLDALDTAPPNTEGNEVAGTGF
jgi:hypothetical protein